MNYHQYPVPVKDIKGVEPDAGQGPGDQHPGRARSRATSPRSRRRAASSSATAPTRSSRPPDDGGGRRHHRAPRRGRARRAAASLGALAGLADARASRSRVFIAARQPRARARARGRAAARRDAAVPARRRRDPRLTRRRPRRPRRATRSSSRSRRSRSTARSSSSRWRFLLPVRGRHAGRLRRRRVRLRPRATSRPALDPLYVETFLRTLRTAAIGTLLIVLVGYPLAYWIARYAPENRRGLFLALIIVPFWTSFLIRTYSFLIVLSPEFFLSDWLQTLQHHRRAAGHPLHDAGDPDRARLQLPAAVRAAALRDARADGLAARSTPRRTSARASGPRSARSRCGSPRRASSPARCSCSSR